MAGLNDCSRRAALHLHAPPPRECGLSSTERGAPSTKA